MTDAIRADAKCADAYLGRGHAYGESGQFDEAIVDLTEALRLDPKSAKAYENRGSAFANKGELDKGIVDYAEAIRLDPNSATARLCAGWRIGGRVTATKGSPT